MIAIVAALKEEVGDFLKRGRYLAAGGDGPIRCFEPASGAEVAVVVGGAGRQRAEAATTLAIETYSPALIVSAGFAGGVRPGLRPADLVLCDTVWSVEGPTERWSRETAQSRSLLDESHGHRPVELLEQIRPRATRAGCLSVPRLITSSSMKGWIGTHFPVCVVDMETFWVGHAAASLETPVIAVRSVFDPAEQTLPPFVADAVTTVGAARWAHALKFALSRPARIPGLVRLAAQAKGARRSLADFLAGIASIGHELTSRQTTKRRASYARN